MSGSKKKEETESRSVARSGTFQFDFTDLEDLLAGLNIDVIRSQIESINQQLEFQRQAFQTAQPALEALTQEQDLRAGLFTEEERRAQLLEQHERQQRSAAAQDELLERQLNLIRQGPGATPEQQRLINESTEAQIRRGEEDILGFGREALGLITQEVAPSRGLRPSDTPIQDRAFRLGGELARQQGQLVSNLRGGQALAELNFPLAAQAQQAGISQFQQGLAQSQQQFQQQLQQQAIANRLNLFGQVGQLGLGSIGAQQPFANLQQAFKPQLGQTAQTITTSKGKSTSASGGISSRDLKHDMRPIDEQQILERLLSLPIEMWQYKFPSRGEHGDHIGTYAEAFQEAFEIGDGTTINYLDAIGVLMASVQALSSRVKELEGSNS
jgi:hypothetical protein